MKNVLLVYGLLTLASSLLYVFAGITLWVPVEHWQSGREFGIFMFHWLGMVALFWSVLMRSCE